MDLLWFGYLLLIRRWVWNAHSIIMVYAQALLHSGVGQHVCCYQPCRYHLIRPWTLYPYKVFGNIKAARVLSDSDFIYLFIYIHMIHECHPDQVPGSFHHAIIGRRQNHFLSLTLLAGLRSHMSMVFQQIIVVFYVIGYGSCLICCLEIGNRIVTSRAITSLVFVSCRYSSGRYDILCNFQSTM